MTIRDDIDQYITYFKVQNQEIVTVARPTFKKVLYLIEIDTLSRAAFPRVTSNRQRVVQFIDASRGNEVKSLFLT